MALPLVAAQAGINTLSPIIGAWGQNSQINKAAKQYREYANKGIDTLNAGKTGVTESMSPYTSTGADAATSQLGAIDNRTQATQPTLSNTSAAGVSDWLDPSMAYSVDQANKAGTAAGIASGGVGGGMLRALSNNANKMAQTNWNNAATQQLAANNQNFGQQQQLYDNTNNYQQQQIDNYGNVANRGVGAASTQEGLLQGYNNTINSNLLGIGESQAGAQMAKGNLWGKLVDTTGKNLSTGITSIWGNK